MRNTLCLFLAVFLQIPIGLGQLSWAQLPDFYKTVDHVQWVVKDLNSVTSAWSRLGFRPIEQQGAMTIKEAQFAGVPVTLKVRRATGYLGSLRVEWVQPIGDRNAYTEFLQMHGDGVFSLVHRVGTLEAFTQELALLNLGGVGVLQRESHRGRTGVAQTAYLDTEADGGYVLGLTTGGKAGDCAVPPTSRGAPHPLKLTQFAFVIREPESVAYFWKRLGFPEFDFVQVPLRDLVFRGQSGRSNQQLAWQRHGQVAYEWCVPLSGATVHDEHLQRHGEGFHHLGFEVNDMDQALTAWEALGIAVVQSGAWGEAGKVGSGRFAYLNTDSLGGVTIELLWNHK